MQTIEIQRQEVVCAILRIDFLKQLMTMRHVHWHNLKDTFCYGNHSRKDCTSFAYQFAYWIDKKLSSPHIKLKYFCTRKSKRDFVQNMMQNVTILLIDLLLIFIAGHSTAKYILVEIDEEIAAKNAKISGMHISHCFKS